MKNKNLIAATVFSTGILFFSACSENTDSLNNDFTLSEKSAVTDSSNNDTCTFNGVLTEAEIEGLVEMREEEKLARDIYLSSFGIYQYQLFSNIAKSEDSHTSAVLRLINGYGLSDPALPEMGQFNNPLFTDLYTQLKTQSSISLAEALKTGAFIEEYDIADLIRLIGNTQNKDLLNVYSNLLGGSKNHLRAFAKALTQQGYEYTPQILDEGQYFKILSESGTSGRGNKKGGNTQTQNNYKNSNTGGACDGTGQTVTANSSQGNGN